MSGTSSEENIRIEHKLDAIILYLKRLTGEEPIQLERPIPGLNGLTNNVCPITNTPVYLSIDAKTGRVKRSDGLSSGLVEGAIPLVPDTRLGSNSILLKDSLGGADDS